MIFVDTNVIMYAVGAEHPLRGSARRFFEEALPYLIFLQLRESSRFLAEALEGLAIELQEQVLVFTR